MGQQGEARVYSLAVEVGERGEECDRDEVCSKEAEERASRWLMGTLGSEAWLCVPACACS